MHPGKVTATAHAVNKGRGSWEQTARVAREHLRILRSPERRPPTPKIRDGTAGGDRPRRMARIMGDWQKRRLQRLGKTPVRRRQESSRSVRSPPPGCGFESRIAHHRAQPGLITGARERANNRNWRPGKTGIGAEYQPLKTHGQGECQSTDSAFPNPPRQSRTAKKAGRLNGGGGGGTV